MSVQGPSTWTLRTLLLLLTNRRKPHIHPKEVYQFADSRFVEVLARCCRTWKGKNKIELSPQHVMLAEAVLKASEAPSCASDCTSPHHQPPAARPQP